jgi:type II secretory pathway pseudopilin PulG
MIPTTPLHLRTLAVSLVELLVVITVLAVIAAISLPWVLNMVPASQYGLAERNLNYLNGAVLNFNQSNWELVLTASSGTDDELAIFNSLRYRAASNPAPGSPYLPDTVKFDVSTNASDYRARWTGRMFELTSPGSSGAGINLLDMIGPPAPASATNTPVPAS